MIKRMVLKIIVLGGIHGVGKTTLAHELSKRLSIMSVIGLGPIISALKEIRCADPLLEKIKSYDRIVYETRNATPQELEERFLAKCKAVGTLITKIIGYQINMGASCIIEGAELLPEFLPVSDIKFFMIAASNEAVHSERLAHPSGSRTKQPARFSSAAILSLQNLLLENARKYEVPIIDNSGTVTNAFEQIIRVLEA